MKKLIFIVLAILSLNANAQTFTLSDTTFHVGDSLIKYIVFQFNHNGVLDESKPTLDSIADFLTKFSNLKIEISNYTDSRGGVEYNQDLSRGRAERVAEYLISKGINISRLKPIGSGKSALIYTDEKISKAETEEEREYLHAKNRRTVFKIIGI